MLVATAGTLLVVGMVLGYFIRHYIALFRRSSVDREVEELILSAKKEAHKIESEALASAHKTREELDKAESRLAKAEERLDKRERDLGAFDEALRKEIEVTRQKSESIAILKENLEKQEKKIAEEIASVAKLSIDEARSFLFEKIERESAQDLQSRMLKLSRDGESRLMDKARDILINAIYRTANTEVATFTTSSVEIDNEEVKGKIIGKEGRNIKTFERATGVDLLVDEAPNLLVVSCFDPIRRAIAKNALETLIKDGRIQPAKIEECVEKAKRDIGVFMKKKGEEAVLECGLVGLPDALIPLIGRLYFRTSYGQNVLNHSIEMAHIAGIIAFELGVDVRVAKMGSLLHDIGKAVDHEIQGTHVEIGRKILMKYGVDERVIKAMQAHHEEYPYETVESIIVQVADAISGGRPGARRDTVDRYIERLQDLEALAMAFSGIERVYALQAGREIRVFVTPTLVSDVEARDLARNIAIRIEEELRYPGEIKINVIRESRSIEFAR